MGLTVSSPSTKLFVPLAQSSSLKDTFQGETNLFYDQTKIQRQSLVCLSTDLLRSYSILSRSVGHRLRGFRWDSSLVYSRRTLSFGYPLSMVEGDPGFRVPLRRRPTPVGETIDECSVGSSLLSTEDPAPPTTYLGWNSSSGPLSRSHRKESVISPSWSGWDK